MFVIFAGRTVGLSPTLIAMTTKKNPPTKPESAPSATVRDIGSISRRRYGRPISTNRNGDAVVLPFPPRAGHPETAAAEKGKEQPCATDASAPASASPRQPTGDALPSPQRNGSNTLGVLVPPFALPRSLSGYRPQDAGILTHALIAMLVPELPRLTPVTLPERIHDLAGALVGGDNVNRRRVLLSTAAGHAATYLRRLAPTSWSLLGCEFDTGNGRVDLAWQHEDGRVFFDEVKTVNRPVAVLTPSWVDQAARYARGGETRFGAQFVGVRLLPIGALHCSALVGGDGRSSVLTPTSADPLASADAAQGGNR